MARMAKEWAFLAFWPFKFYGLIGYNNNIITLETAAASFLPLLSVTQCVFQKMMSKFKEFMVV